MLHIGDNGENCLAKSIANRVVQANFLSDAERPRWLCWDCAWHPGTLCLIAQANINAYHHSTPTEKAASRSCPNTKAIADLATGRDPPQRWVMLTPLLIRHRRLEESPHGRLKSTLYFFLPFFSLKNSPRALQFLSNEREREKRRIPINTPTHANDWLVVMHGLVRMVRSQSNIQTDQIQTLVRPSSHGLQHQTKSKITPEVRHGDTSSVVHSLRTAAAVSFSQPNTLMWPLTSAYINTVQPRVQRPNKHKCTCIQL